MDIFECDTMALLGAMSRQKVVRSQLGSSAATEISSASFYGKAVGSHFRQYYIRNIGGI